MLLEPFLGWPQCGSFLPTVMTGEIECEGKRGERANERELTLNGEPS